MYHLTPRPFVSSGLSTKGEKYCSSSLFSYVLPIISLCLPCFWLKMEYKWNKNGAVVILKLSTELLWCWVGMSGRNRTMGRRRRKRRREGRATPVCASVRLVRRSRKGGKGWDSSSSLPPQGQVAPPTLTRTLSVSCCPRATHLDGKKTLWVCSHTCQLKQW